ncbi:MAG: type II toxin-antitoxin system VapC family toxin [Desulfurococcales archaeon]|nr:type II toxin-antitoxin system VapC family toxin [Desulfurococcales archaeon]
MKVFIDSPLFIYLNTIADSKDRVPYENFYIDLLTNYKPYTDVLVLDELIYVSKRKYGIPYDLTVEFIESSIRPYVIILSLGEDEYVKAAKFMIEYNLKPSDALHLAAMVNNGMSLIASEDREFDKVSLVKRIWV